MHDRGDGFQLGFCKLRRNHFCNLLRCVRLHEVHSLLQCLREFFYGCAVRFQITLFDAVRRIRHIPGFRSDRCHDIAVALLLEQCRGRFKFNRIIPLPAGERGSCGTKIDALVDIYVFFINPFLRQNILKDHFRHTAFSSP